MRFRRRRLLIWISRRGINRTIAAVTMIALLAVLFTYDYETTRTWSHWTLPLSGKTIAIDAGHGGVDGGAVSDSGLVEKDVTLAIALQLRDYLQQAGAIVMMTREDDRDLASPDTRGYSRRKTEDLYKRAALVKEANADMMVTIHLNSVPSARWSGAQTFYYPGREEGMRLATLIQEELRVNLQNTERQANTVSTVFLLKTMPMPTALVEVGFLSNPREAALLGDDSYQHKLSAAIYRGILRYASGEQANAP